MSLQHHVDRVCFALLLVSTLVATGLGVWGIWREDSVPPAVGKLLITSAILAFASGWMLSACRMRGAPRADRD